MTELGERAYQAYQEGLNRASGVRLTDGQTLSVHAGLVLSKSAGSSMEYMETRAYQPGDDLRLVDWHAAARTKKLMMKQYHQEALAHLDIILDLSQSMSLPDTKKWACLWGACGYWVGAARNSGYTTQLWNLKQSIEPIYLAADEQIVELEAQTNVPPDLVQHALPFQPMGIRIFMSDLMWPGPPESMTEKLYPDAADFIVFQILGEEEWDPKQRGWARLLDAETGQPLEVNLEKNTLTEYQAILQNHQKSWRDAVQTAGGHFAFFCAEPFLENWDWGNLYGRFFC